MWPKVVVRTCLIPTIVVLRDMKFRYWLIGSFRFHKRLDTELKFCWVPPLRLPSSAFRSLYVRLRDDDVELPLKFLVASLTVFFRRLSSGLFLRSCATSSDGPDALCVLAFLVNA